MTQPKSPRVNPTRGAPNYAELLRLILSVILRVYSRHDSVGENPIRTWATRPLAIDFFAMSDAKDQHDQAVVVDLADDPVITHAVFPELPKS